MDYKKHQWYKYTMTILNKNESIRVLATWDDESAVFIAVSNQVPGLSAKAPTKKKLKQRLHNLIPELLNKPALDDGGLPFFVYYKAEKNYAPVSLRVRHL